MTAPAAFTIAGQWLVAGDARGVALVTSEPLSFWGGYDAADRPDHRRGPSALRRGRRRGRILALPFSRGSSTTTAVLLEAIRAGTAPAAIVVAGRDTFFALAAVVAEVMYARRLPVLAIGMDDLERMASGDRLRLSPRRCESRTATLVYRDWARTSWRPGSRSVRVAASQAIQVRDRLKGSDEGLPWHLRQRLPLRPSSTLPRPPPPSPASTAARRVPPPVNEPVRTYAPGSPERARAQGAAGDDGGGAHRDPARHRRQEVRTGQHRPRGDAARPRARARRLPQGAPRTTSSSADRRALAAQREWASWPWEDRAAIFLRAAELLATTWRATLNAATMLGQSKTAYQAEIDAACELIDFWRFNAHFAQELYDEQPISDHGVWNQIDYRALEGFVYAVTPFNFTAIGGNLPTAPALMGNTVVWKPASSAMLSRLLHHAAARGGGAAARRDQLRRPATPRMITNVVLVAPRSRRRPLHRQHRRLQLDVEDDRRNDVAPTARIRASSARPAARTSSSRTRRPTRRRWRWRSSAAASSTRGRSARRRAASTCPRSLWKRGARPRRRR